MTGPKNFSLLLRRKQKSPISHATNRKVEKKKEIEEKNNSDAEEINC